ncbi:glycoside hydrolase family 5 protein [Sodiomyces alcalophilus JCM 7366]|uniref:glycoside hydrolase family 5 protein n=1 Tax=Sodiomyces alcalophilus JCM 7366 TaxID=591952 RepID=UPI0039B430F5
MEEEDDDDDDDDDDDEGEERRGNRRYSDYGDSPRRPRRAAYRHRQDYSDDEYESPRRRPPRGRTGNQRVVSGAALEEGQGWRLGGFLGRLRGGGGSSAPSYDRGKERDESDYDPPRPVRKKNKWIIIGIAVALLVIIIVVAVVVSKNNSSNNDDNKDSSSKLDEEKKNSIPMQWRGTYLDPFSWKSTDDFNVTFTDEMVGGLPVMGLFTKWDDSARANDKVPPLDEEWGSYEERPARGVNVGGWLSLEPFITPSLFDYDRRYGIVDEYTLCQHLGPRTTAEVLEKHYASFVTESTFKEIRDAGLDHVRIPFSYWAVEVYEGDPYLFRTSWRYLLRAIEWCRKYGLRVNLDPHGIPGSQNGWNHSGRQGAIGWMNGTHGTENRRRSIEFHDRLSKFFAQDRYRNIVAFYGVANEPRMTELSSSDVMAWTEEVYKLVRDNGVRAAVVFGDGFMGLHNWQGQMTGYDDLVLDVHQYVIFNRDQIALSHQEKVEFACDEWTAQARQSMDRSTGYGPTLFAEWSQADTDCAPHLTNVGRGNRWTGTYETGRESTDVLEPRCPTLDDRCDCGPANADIGDMSDEYKRFLRMFAEAQMHSFEKGWGWWYWTWDTESAPLWSYKKALAAGIMPKKPWNRDFDCNGNVPSFKDLPEFYRR